MGRSLHASSEAARAVYGEAAAVLGWDLARVSFEGPESELTQTRVCQPALVRQVVSPVLWEDCMRSAAEAGATEFWELGPGTSLARRTDKAWKVRSLSKYADLAG